MEQQILNSKLIKKSQICNIIKQILDKFPIFIRVVFRSSQCFSVKTYPEVRDSWHILSHFALKEYRQFSLMLREAYTSFLKYYPVVLSQHATCPILLVKQIA
jgi:hypothetical protein